ncbi:zinc finger protein 91 [Nothobranchius furzeri]
MDELHTLTLNQDVRQIMLVKEEAPEEQSADVDQQDPEHLHIKEEREELWTSLKGEQIHLKEETDASRFPLTPFSIKSDGDEEKPVFSQLLQEQTEDRVVSTNRSADQMTAETGEGAETSRNYDLNPHKQTSDSSETEVSEDDKEEGDVSLDSELSQYGPETRDGDNDWNESKYSDSEVKTINKSISCPECGEQFLNKWSLRKHLRVTSHSALRSSGCFVNKKCVRVKKHIHTCEKVQTELKPFNCDNCGKICSTKSNLNRHMMVHIRPKPFACDLCGQRFSQKRILNCHMSVHTGQKPFVCDLCGQGFSKKTSLNSHMNIHTGQKPFVCEICGQRFNRKTTLISHKIIHTGQRPFACKVCGQRFRKKTCVNRHMRVHTGQKPFACDLCGQRFGQKTNLNRHMMLHTGQKPFVCDLCGQRFGQQQQLKSHMSAHTEQKPFPCELCGKRFNHKASLKIHMRVHNGLKSFPCQLCGKIFNYKTCLNIHMRVHTGQKPFACDICGQRFRQKPHLNRHMSVHEENKPLACKLCKQILSSKTTLINHMRGHREQKPFACKNCGQIFSQKTSLNRHMSVHTGEKPFACELCGQRFSQKTSLNRHARVHTGQKPFACDFCGQGFSLKHHLNRHIRVHTGEKPFSCDLCGQRFNQTTHLNTHMRLHTFLSPYILSTCHFFLAGESQIVAPKLTKLTQNSFRVIFKMLGFIYPRDPGDIPGLIWAHGGFSTSQVQWGCRPRDILDPTGVFQNGATSGPQATSFWLDSHILWLPSCKCFTISPTLTPVLFQHGRSALWKRQAEPLETGPLEAGGKHLVGWLQARSARPWNSLIPDPPEGWGWRQDKRQLTSNAGLEETGTAPHDLDHLLEDIKPAKPAYWTRIIGQGHGRRFLLVGVYRAVVTFEAPTELEVLAGAWTVLAGTAGARTELAVLEDVEKLPARDEEVALLGPVEDGIEEQPTRDEEVMLSEPVGLVECLPTRGEEVAPTESEEKERKPDLTGPKSQHTSRKISFRNQIKALTKNAFCQNGQKSLLCIHSPVFSCLVCTYNTQCSNSGSGSMRHHFHTWIVPPLSLDPIENLWDVLEKALCSSQTLPTSVEDLGTSLILTFHVTGLSRAQNFPDKRTTFSPHAELFMQERCCPETLAAHSSRLQLFLIASQRCTVKMDGFHTSAFNEGVQDLGPALSPVPSQEEASRREITDCHHDFLQIMLVKEEAPEGSADVEQQYPDNLHIKEEQQELWTSLEGEQLQLKEETDAARFPFSDISIKSEDDEEKFLFSQLHHQQTEDLDVPTSSSDDQMTADTGGRAETSRNLDLNSHEQKSDSSETEVSGDDEEDVNLVFEQSDCGLESGDIYKDWNETRSSESDVKSVNKSCSCSECGEQFLNELSLQKHVRVTSHLAGRYSGCLVNKKSVGVKKHTDQCRKVQTKLKSFSCDDCGKGFVTKYNLNRHMSVHTGQKLFACDLCEQKFSREDTLNCHMSVHTGQKPFTCELCGKRFSQRTTLNRHMRVHTGQRPFACELCGKRFSQKICLNRHIRVHTGQKPFACELCGQRFRRKTCLNRHIIVHTGQKPFACDLCGQRFSHKTSLNRHVLVHTGQKPFACELCGQRFSQKTCLNRHVLVHTGQKPFACELCGQRFGLKQYLIGHMRVHTGQKPFACKLCKQRFSHIISLIRHTRIHTGQKPFGCELCGQRFSQKQHLNRHINVHKGLKAFACKLCKKRFSRKTSLNNHMQVHTTQT